MRYYIRTDDKAEGERLLNEIRNALKQRRPNIKLAMQHLVKLNDIFLNIKSEDD